MTIDNFYTVEQPEQSGDQQKARIVLNEHHPIYGGHFPGRPVVPGVMQIEMVRELAQRHLKMNLRIERVVTAKYFQPLLPGEQPELSVTFSVTEKEGGYPVTATLARNGTVFSKIKLVCRSRG